LIQPKHFEGIKGKFWMDSQFVLERIFKLPTSPESFTRKFTSQFNGYQNVLLNQSVNIHLPICTRRSSVCPFFEIHCPNFLFLISGRQPTITDLHSYYLKQYKMSFTQLVNTKLFWIFIFWKQQTVQTAGLRE